MFRRRLDAGEGLCLRPCQSVHTFWMFFPIDILFLDRNLTVLSMIENLRPFRVTWPRWQATSVVELAAGTVARTGLRVGDELALVRGGES